MKSKHTDPRSASPMDRAIGRRIRSFRDAAGIGQVALAEKLGVTFQQVQKYESGTNRVAASRLYQIATALDVPIVRFFEG